MPMLFKNSFGPEIRNNLMRRFGDQFSQNEVIFEGKMYALDMCLEFQQQSGGLLTADWIGHISKEVYLALCEYICDIQMPKEDFVTQILIDMQNPLQAQELVNSYYNRI